MCSAHRLMVLYIGVMFREHISNDIRVIVRTRNYEALTGGWADGRTDTQNFERYNIIPRNFLFGT